MITMKNATTDVFVLFRNPTIHTFWTLYI